VLGWGAVKRRVAIASFYFCRQGRLPLSPSFRELLLYPKKKGETPRRSIQQRRSFDCGGPPKKKGKPTGFDAEKKRAPTILRSFGRKEKKPSPPKKKKKKNSNPAPWGRKKKRFVQPGIKRRKQSSHLKKRSHLYLIPVKAAGPFWGR